MDVVGIHVETTQHVGIEYCNDCVVYKRIVEFMTFLVTGGLGLIGHAQLVSTIMDIAM